MKILVKIKNPAKRKLLMDLEVELPAYISTLRELLTEMVRWQVAEYNAKKLETPLQFFISENELQQQAETTGKVGFGARYNERNADPDQAVEVAIQAFEDGLFRIFAGTDELTVLDEPLTLADGAEIMIIKLTMLAGRMW